ncbi:PLP-dependent aminotransferase family protein [Parahaliea mediterranea]|uniref:PLP-dependent aminotransferase family protein n=1 Tax=Parahaliea mediterranea TaxID=651086 RepID=A0A939DGV2_9GAMM|nr:PLP-dependent aminotransferase family protein [Parahaliea mediterranea]MBN7797621.1 PLP-dependent aminotransferase family protein [Parahaliea mediterranea]
MLRPWQTRFWLSDAPGDSLQDKLVNQLTLDIQSGRLAPGDWMPGSRTLAQQLDLNRKTVQAVYEELEAQGWLVSQPRRGTFVADVLPERDFPGDSDRLARAGQAMRPASPLVASLYSNILSASDQSPGANDGTPDVRLIPYELLSRAYRRALIRSIKQQHLGYGDPRGTVELRQSIQKMLVMDRFMRVADNEICIVRGSQMGIFLASRVLDPRQGAIVLEELSYPPALAAFEANGFRVVRCKLDSQGLDTNALQGILKRHKVAAVFTTAHHQYPTTVTMAMERRLMLLKLSREYGFAVLEDDYDHEFHYESRPIPPLASLPGSENVIHIGSLSKVFAPGLRLGYLVAGSQFIDRIAQEILLIDRQGSAVGELAVAGLMESGEVKKHIRRVRKLYRARRDFAAETFRRVFNDRVEFELPAGGMALWVNVGEGMGRRQLEALQHGDFNHGSQFGSGRSGQGHIRFGFGALTEAETSAAVEQLASLLKARA